MGDLLQIRVIAWTYGPEDAEKYWPRLFQLAWPDQAKPPMSKRGVLETVEALDQMRALGLWPDLALSALLGEEIRQLVKIKTALEDALGEWRPSEANKLSVELENAMIKLEHKLPNSTLKKNKK